MSKRMMDVSMLQSESLGELPIEARLLLVGMILLADDQGRLRANPLWLKSQVFPYDSIDAESVSQALHGIANNDTIILYTAEGKQYAQFVNWWKYQSLQYAMPSKLPRPAGWKDRIRYNHTKGAPLTYNWILTNGTPTEDTCDEYGNPIHVAKIASKPSNPPRGSLNKPESPQVDNQVDNQVDIQEEDKEEEEDKGDVGNTACASEPEAPTPPSPPPNVPESKTQTNEDGYRDTLPGEYLPGLSRPKRYQLETTVTQAVADAKRFGVEPVVFREMTDCLLIGCGKKAAADVDTQEGEQVLLHAQATVLSLVKMDARFRSVAGIQSVFDSWRDNDWRGDTVPSSLQVFHHASLMVSGKVVCERKDKPKTPQPLPEPKVVKRYQFDPMAPKKGYFSQQVEPQ